MPLRPRRRLIEDTVQMEMWTLSAPGFGTAIFLKRRGDTDICLGGSNAYCLLRIEVKEYTPSYLSECFINLPGKTCYPRMDERWSQAP